MRAAVRVFAAVSLLMSFALPLVALADPTPPPTERRHSSGLVVLGPADYSQLVAPPPALGNAWSAAWSLAEDNPDVFGYPWMDLAKGELVVSVVNATGESIARSWIQSGAQRKQSEPMFPGGPPVTRDPGSIASGPGATPMEPAPTSQPRKPEMTALTRTPPPVAPDGARPLIGLELPRPEVPVRFRTVTRSFTQLQGILHAVGPGLAGIPGSDRIYVAAPDDAYNRVIYETDLHNDALFTALAERFGTAALAVRVDPNMGRPELMAGRGVAQVDDAVAASAGSVLDPRAAAVIGGVFVLAGTTILLRRRRAA
jgi:hypothetical protein